MPPGVGIAQANVALGLWSSTVLVGQSICAVMLSGLGTRKENLAHANDARVEN
jgi:hypothetical protein